MRVLAIDPGNIESAYCVLESDTLRPDMYEKTQNGIILAAIRKKPPVDIVVIERIASYGMAVGREVFETCEWVGRFAEAAERNGMPVEYIYRRNEKLHICNDPRAKDANIRRALIDRFAKHDFKNGRGTKNNPDWFYGFRADIWAAYAVGLTWVETKKEG